MNLKIRFTSEGAETYFATVVQLRERWGDKFVEEFEIKVDKSLEIISGNPLFYPLAKGNDSIRKCVLHKNCSMLYKVFDDRIEIFCFWDNRQGPMFAF